MFQPQKGALAGDAPARRCPAQFQDLLAHDGMPLPADLDLDAGSVGGRGESPRPKCHRALGLVLPAAVDPRPSGARSIGGRTLQEGHGAQCVRCVADDPSLNHRGGDCRRVVRRRWEPRVLSAATGRDARCRDERQARTEQPLPHVSNVGTARRSPGPIVCNTSGYAATGFAAAIPSAFAASGKPAVRTFVALANALDADIVLVPRDTGS